MTEPKENRQDRLAEAIEVYLQRPIELDGDESGSADELLERNEPLREFLEPMLAGRPTDGSDPSPEAATFAAGRVVGDFRVGAEIGRGGMGAVFEARQISLDREVALKVLLPHLTLGPNQIARFRAEASNAARLQHPSIVPIYEVGEVAGVHFFAMELVHGERLDEHVRQMSGTVGSAAQRIALVVELVAQVADALEYAHQSGVLHRDIKPHNILVSGGRARLLDFGLSKLIDVESGSRSGDFVGTPHYASPEQATGSKTRLGPHSDVFSLGVVLYELLAGARPFSGESSEDVVESVLRHEPRKLRSLDPKIPRDLETICVRALEKDPGQRYASAQDIAADLRAFQRHEPIRARPVSWAGRTWRFARRRPALVMACGLGIAVAVGVPSGILWHQSTTEIERENSRRADAVAFSAMQGWLSGLRNQVEQDFKLDVEDRRELDVAARTAANYGGGVLDLERRRSASASMETIAEVFTLTGSYDRALEVNQTGLDLLTDEQGAPLPDVESGIREALLRSQRARILDYEDGDSEESGAQFQRARELWEIAIRDGAAERRSELLIALALACAQRGGHLAERRDGRAEGFELLNRSIELMLHPEAEAARREDPESQCRFAWTLNRRARLHGQAQEVEAAAADLAAVDAALAPLDEGRLGRRLESAFRDVTRAEIAMIDPSLGDDVELLRSATTTLSEVVAEFPGRLDYQSRLAAASCRYGAVLLQRGVYESAAAEFRKARVTARAILDRRGALGRAVDARYALAFSCSMLANCITVNASSNIGPSPSFEARDLLLEAESAQTELVKDSSHLGFHYQLGNIRQMLAEFETNHGDPALARDYALAAVEAQSFALEGHPKHPQFELAMGRHYAQLCWAQALLGDVAAAKTAADQALGYVADDPITAGNVAEGLIRCVPAVESDSALTDSAREEAVEGLITRSLAILSTIVERHRGDVGHALSGSGFAPFADRDDVQVLWSAVRGAR